MSGWFTYGICPNRFSRTCAESSSSGSRLRAALRQRSKMAVDVRITSSPPPATARTSSQPIAAGRSWSVTASHSATVRTE